MSELPSSMLRGIKIQENHIMFRYLAPAGNTIRAHEIVKALRVMFKDDSAEVFTRKLKALLKVKHCFLTSSGTVALYLALVSLSKLVNKREVIFSAYTCPSVLAAVIRAGLKPVLCDLDNKKSNMNLNELAAKITGDTLAIISVHLFGIKENTAKINELTSSHNIFHIEDAAQSFGLAAARNQEISRSCCPSEITGTAGIFSFGRGKPLTLLQGGALATDSDTIAEAVMEKIRDVEQQHTIDTALLILKTALYALFFHPRLYWIARRIPFLKLGKTIFDRDFEMKQINAFTCALGSIMIDHVPHITMTRRQKERLLFQGLSPLTDHFLAGSQDNDSLLRFPLLLEDKAHREHVLSRLNQCGLGATSMYEAPLHLFKDTKKYFPGNNYFSNALSFSERILSLPLHAFVTAHDIGAMSAIINQSVNRNH